MSGAAGGMSGAPGGKWEGGMGGRFGGRGIDPAVAPHPEEGQLLRYLDGELPRRKARHIREHLEACWQCRVELQELQAAVADCVQYRKKVLETCLPPPPQPWNDLSRGFDRIDSSLAGESLLASVLRLPLFRTLFRSPLKWAVAFAVLVAFAGIAFRQLRETPSVQAAVLLQRAVAVSESRPRAVRRIRITTRSARMTKVIGGGSLPVSAAAEPGMAGELEHELEQRFRAAHYNWDDPLSAKSYALWRDHLAAKQDSVNTEEDRRSPERNTYNIKTTTQDGDLVAATLKFRMTDFAPLEGRFEFRNRDWVEMTALADQQTSPARTTAGAPGGMPRQPGMPPVFITPSAEANAPSADANPSGGYSAELRVVEALHEVGADLGDPVEISRDGAQVLVSGTGIPPKRQDELHAVLDPLPNVVVRFASPAFPASAAPVQTEPAPTREAAGPQASPQAGPQQGQYQSRMEARLGGRPQFERFSGQLLDLTDSAMARAYALRRLAQEFPASAERRMSVREARVLHNLGREHLAAFAKETARIEASLHPILTSLGAMRGAGAAPGAGAVPGAAAIPPTEAGTDAASWQAATGKLLSAARSLETLVAAVLGASVDSAPGGARDAGAAAAPDAGADAAREGTSAADNSPEHLLAALAQLTTSIEQCRRLLLYDDARQSK